MNLIEKLYLTHIKSIREYGVDNNALTLNQNLKSSFNTKSKYFLFNGDLKAKTVFVMLNPGVADDKNIMDKGCLHKKTDKQVASDMINECINYAETDYDRLDNFDLKQAAFLNYWENTGINLIKNFWEEDKDANIKKWKDAKRNVLKDKLQLELIPYGSAEFVKLFDSQKRADNNVKYITEYIENLFNIITTYDRNIVLFGSKQFYYIFKSLIKLNWDITLKVDATSFEIEGLKNKVSFSLFEIKYNDKLLKLGIPHSFPRRDLPNAYSKMALYGKECFKIYHQ